VHLQTQGDHINGRLYATCHRSCPRRFRRRHWLAACHSAPGEGGYTVIGIQNPLTSLADDIATTKHVIVAKKGSVVVVGHSYGGVVITGAAAEAPNVKSLVYLAAFAPDINEPVGPLLEKYPTELDASLVTDAAGFGYIDRAKFHAVFCADVSDQEARMMAATQKPIALASFGATLSEAAWKTIPSWYLVSGVSPDSDSIREKATPPQVWGTRAGKACEFWLPAPQNWGGETSLQPISLL